MKTGYVDPKTGDVTLLLDKGVAEKLVGTMGPNGVPWRNITDDDWKNASPELKRLWKQWGSTK